MLLWPIFIVVVMKTLKCIGTVPLPGRVMFGNIPKKTFPYSPMILLLQTYPQKLFHPPQVPPLILPLPISFWKGPKCLNNIWKKWPKLHLPNALLSKAQSNQAKNAKMSRSLGPTQVTAQSHSIHSPT